MAETVVLKPKGGVPPVQGRGDAAAVAASDGVAGAFPGGVLERRVEEVFDLVQAEFSPW
uniref:hypothetical protein n=1 Tax=Streptomyces gramineus TaxID=910542 RepID=UPI00398B6F50